AKKIVTSSQTVPHLKRAAIPLFVLLLCSLSMDAQTVLIDSLIRVVARDNRDTAQVRAISDLSYELSRTDIAKEKEYLYKGITLSKHLNSFLLPGLYSMLTTAHQTLTHI